MRIRRFVAADMRGALHQVRDAQGPDAVILSSRKLDDGRMEVVAATDYDEALAQQMLAREPSAPTMSAETRGQVAEQVAALAPPATAPSRAPLRAITAHDPASQAWQENPAMNDVRRELATMREMIERQTHRFTEERLRGVPIRAQTLDELASFGVDAALARSIATAVPTDADRGRARGMMLGLLAKSLVVPRREPIEEGGVMALIGATGVGKTTTIAKLAARFAHGHSARDVALVTTDTVRVGGREQLYTYGRQLGMPVFEVTREGSLSEVLERLNDYKLILVDTPGLGQRDRGLVTQVNWLRAARRVRCFLAMPANAQPSDLDEVVRRFRGAEPEGVVLTKLDETGCLGAAMSVLIRHRLPVAYITDGQRVPDDIHRAEAHRLVLRLGELRRAAEAEDKESTNAAA